VFIETCALGLAVRLDLFQTHLLVPCRCSLPTESSREGLQLEDFTFVHWHAEILHKIHWVIVFHIGGLGALFGGLTSTKAPMATGLVTNRRLFRRLYYPNMPGETQAFWCSALITTSYVRRVVLTFLKLHSQNITYKSNLIQAYSLNSYSLTILPFRKKTHSYCKVFTFSFSR